MTTRQVDTGSFVEAEDLDEWVPLGDIGVQLGTIEHALERHWEGLIGSDPVAAAHVILATRFVHRAVLALTPDTIA